MIAEIVFGLTIMTGPHTHSQARERFALGSAVTFFLEGVADCEQTKTRIFRFNTVEHNQLTPRAVLQQFHRDHAGLCIAGFGLSSAALYFATRKMDQAVPAVAPLLEAVNLTQQAHN